MVSIITMASAACLGSVGQEQESPCGEVVVLASRSYSIAENWESEAFAEKQYLLAQLQVGWGP